MKKVKQILKSIGLMFLGLFAFLYYTLKWLFQKLIVCIHDNKVLRKIVLFIAKLGDIIYAPVFYSFYVISIVLRFLTCVCYFFMFQRERAAQSLKYIFK